MADVKLTPCICEKASPDPSTHEHDCPVRRRADREATEEVAASASVEIRGECPWPGKVQCPVCRLWFDSLERHQRDLCAGIDRSAPACSCGLGSTKPAYRHERGCPVYRAWVERPRAEDGFAVGQAVLLKGHDLRGRVICVDARGPSAVVVLWDKGATEVAEHMAESLLEPAPRRAVVWVGASKAFFDGSPNCIGVYLGEDGCNAKKDGLAAALVRVELVEGEVADD